MPPGRLSRRTYLKVTAAALAAPADWLLARAARAGGEASVRVRTNVPWTTKHQTHSVTVSRFYDVWNRGPGEPWRPGLEALRAIVREAESAGAHLRAVGAGWSLSDAALTDGFLVNTMPLNHQRIGLAPDEVTAAITDRQHLVFAQCGASNHRLKETRRRRWPVGPTVISPIMETNGNEETGHAQPSSGASSSFFASSGIRQRIPRYDNTSMIVRSLFGATPPGGGGGGGGGV